MYGKRRSLPKKCIVCYKNPTAATAFNQASSTRRSVAQIQCQWRGTKMQAKARISHHRKEVNATGGGPPPQSPNREDIDLLALIPEEFEVDCNAYECDAAVENVEYLNEDVEEPMLRSRSAENIADSENVDGDDSDVAKKKKLHKSVRALKQSMHTLNYEIVSVKPCPSWEQPFQASNGLRVVKIDDEDTKVISILNLNDYCLEMIYKKLDLKQQVRLSLCHGRLENVFARMICPRIIKGFNFEQIRGFTLWEMRQLFKTAGQFMNSLEIERIDCMSTMKHESNIYEFMREYCSAVRRLQIIRRRFIFTNFLNVLNTQCITELELYECDLYESELNHLRALKNLQALGLARNRNIFGYKLSQLRKLTKLSLFGCSKVTQANLIDICKSLQLRFLDVRCMDGIRNWSAIVEHCTFLETFKISRIDCDGREGAESIARLPKLKKLNMEFYVRAMPSSFYDALVDHHADDLEELKITGNVYAFFPTVAANIVRLKKLRVLWLGDNEYNSSKDFLKMIGALKDLQELNLNYSTRIKGDHLLSLYKYCHKLKCLSLRYCKNITNDFIFKTITILEKRAKLYNTPKLLMLVGGTRVKRDILKDVRYLNIKHLLHLSFHLDNVEPGFLEEKNEFSLVDEHSNENASIGDVDDYGEDDTDDLNSYSFSEESSDDELEIFFWL